MSIQVPNLIGGITVLGNNATRLSDDDTPMTQLSIRSNSTAADVYFGSASVTHVDHVGYIEGGESFQWGPYTAGRGIRPSQVFLYGTAGDRVIWTGWPA
jgi:hypothetical protein